MAKEKKKVLKYDMSKFLDYFERFKRSGFEFILEQDASIKSIKWGDDNEIVFRDYDSLVKKEKDAGFHISRMVKADVLKFNESNPNYGNGHSVIISDIYPEISKANMVGLKKNEGNMIYSVDINDCYWDTAKKLGFISDLTYYKALQKKAWKTGRNASIGSLGKNLVVSKYVNGELVSSEIDKESRKLSIIRDNVVSYVHESFLTLLKQLGDDWLMYFTDCVYVPYNKILEVQEYFKALGYQSKVSTYDLDSVNEKTGLVNWFDFKANLIPKELRKKVDVVNKSYYFSKNQRTLEPRNFLEAVTAVKQVQNQPRLNDNTDFLNQPPC